MSLSHETSGEQHFVDILFFYQYVRLVHNKDPKIVNFAKFSKHNM